MLFNSVEFIFLFLPVCLFFFTFLEKKYGRVAALISLILGSAYFYASWHPWYLVILIVSIFGNYFVGSYIQASESALRRKAAITIAIILNLALLYYFKYLIFTLSLLHIPADQPGDHFFRQWALPLGISFWTFQQINFLLERYNKRKDKLHLLDYAAIVMFFPHLIAGPIVRAAELGPQMRGVGTRKRNVTTDIAVGTVLFIVGLTKKVLIADTISAFPTHLYQLQPNEITAAGPVMAWFSIFAYMLQLYFDFSGYCDMGMGLARMFGFIFPLNFNSPLKATSFVAFWRTWHMTLTRFFTDTLHTPMAMNLMRRYGFVKFHLGQSLITVGIPVLFTFFLTGIWHGAGNQFVVFGLLNGVFMAIGVLLMQAKISLPWRSLSQILTFCLVSIVFIFFRAPNFHIGLTVLLSLFHRPHISDFRTLTNFVLDQHRLNTGVAFAALIIAMAMPNIYQLVSNYHVPLGFKPLNKGWGAQWRLPLGTSLGIVMAIALLIALYQLLRGGAIEFLYFQF